MEKCEPVVRDTRSDVRDTWQCKVCLDYRIHSSRYVCSSCGAPRSSRR